VRRCAGAPFAEMEMREVVRAAAESMSLSPVRPQPESARRSALVVTPHRGGEVLVVPRPPKMGQTPHVAGARRA
jgi:cytochrome P450